MATVYVNDKPVDIGNERLNCIQAAEKAGVLIPSYCWHPALTVVASCRMCLVEVGELKDGKVLIPPKVFPGCQTPVKDGTVIVTGEYAKRDARVAPLAYPDKYAPESWQRKLRRIRSKASSSITRSIALSATRPVSASCRITVFSSAGPKQDWSMRRTPLRTSPISGR